MYQITITFPSKRSVQLTTLLLLFSFISNAQNIKGRILDTDTNQPIENVNVYFKSDRQGVTTSSEGEFKLKVKSEIHQKDTVCFSFIGYRTVQIPVKEFNKGVNLFFLSKKTDLLNEVIVSDNRSLNEELKFKKFTKLSKGVYNFGSDLIGNKIYISGGDRSIIYESSRIGLEKANHKDVNSFEGMLREISSSPMNWEGYSNTLQIFDFNTNTCIELEEKVKERAYHQMVHVDSTLYIIGGKTLSPNRRHEYLADEIEMLDLNTGEIKIDKTNPHQSVNPTAIAYQEFIFVMGGSIKQKNNGKKVYTDLTHIYNTKTGLWYELDRMSEGKEANGVLVKNKIFLVGGENNKPLKSIESYDIESGLWRKEGDLFEGIINPALVYKNDVIYIFSKDKLTTFNVLTHLMNEYDTNIEIQGAKMYILNDKLYVFGGYEKDDFVKVEQRNIYILNLSELENTKINRSTEVYNRSF